jgi:hypothetical protein
VEWTGASRRAEPHTHARRTGRGRSLPSLCSLSLSRADFTTVLGGRGSVRRESVYSTVGEETEHGQAMDGPGAWSSEWAWAPRIRFTTGFFFPDPSRACMHARAAPARCSRAPRAPLSHFLFTVRVRPAVVPGYCSPVYLGPAGFLAWRRKGSELRKCAARSGRVWGGAAGGNSGRALLGPGVASCPGSARV